MASDAPAPFNQIIDAQAAKIALLESNAQIRELNIGSLQAKIAELEAELESRKEKARAYVQQEKDYYMGIASDARALLARAAEAAAEQLRCNERQWIVAEKRARHERDEARNLADAWKDSADTDRRELEKAKALLARRPHLRKVTKDGMTFLFHQHQLQNHDAGECARLGGACAK
jgi:chromosome segregation ATPase